MLLRERYYIYTEKVPSKRSVALPSFKAIIDRFYSKIIQYLFNNLHGSSRILTLI